MLGRAVWLRKHAHLCCFLEYLLELLALLSLCGVLSWPLETVVVLTRSSVSHVLKCGPIQAD